MDTVSRRKFLKGLGVAAAGTAIVACQPQTVIVERTVEVEKEKIVTQVVEVEKEVTKIVAGTPVVEKVVETKVVEKQVTPTPVPRPVNLLGTELPDDALPFEEQILTIGGGGSSAAGQGHIMESLYNRCWTHVLGHEIMVELDQNFNQVGIAADSWEPGPDGTYWDFYLNKGLHYTDGTPVTAHDWEYTFKWSFGHGYDFVWFYYDFKNARKVASGEVDKEELGIEALDDYTLRVHTEGVIPYLPLLWVWSGVAPTGIWEELGEDWIINMDTHVSSGSMVLTEFNRGVRSTWALRDDYDEGPRRGQQYYTEIREWPMPAGSLATYMAGESIGWSIGPATPAAEVALVNANPVLRAESQATPPTSTLYLGFNSTGKFEPLANKDVRLALCKAFDKETLIADIYLGFANAAGGVLPAGFPNENNAEWKTLDINVYDPEAAKQLLSKGGYPDGAGFPKYEIWMRSPGQQELALAQAIQYAWKEVLGIEVELRPSDYQSFTSNLKENEPFYWVPYNNDYPDPSTFMNIFKDGGRHPCEDPEYTDFYTKANQILDPTERFTELKKAEKMLIESANYCFLVQSFSIALIPCHIKGPWMEPNKDGYRFFGGAGGAGGPGSNHGFVFSYWGSDECRKALKGGGG